MTDVSVSNYKQLHQVQKPSHGECRPEYTLKPHKVIEIDEDCVSGRR